MKKRVPAAEARAGMKDLVDAVKERNERIKITRYGKTVAYLVPPEDGEALEICGDELEECRKRHDAAAADKTARLNSKQNGKQNGGRVRNKTGNQAHDKTGKKTGKAAGKQRPALATEAAAGARSRSRARARSHERQRP
jgi:prevent-host-death family protein